MASKSVRSKTRSSKTPEFVGLLKKDHRKVQGLFKQFENTENVSKKLQIVRSILDELTVHAKAEEEIVYPAFRESLKDEKTEDLMDEADEEHHVAKFLIAELEEMKPGDDHYDAKVTVLGEVVDHHIQEEEEQMFPKAKKVENPEEVAERLVQRKKELMNELTQDREMVFSQKNS